MNHCVDCRFWERQVKIKKNSVPGETGEVFIGTCRRYPPHQYWPGVREDDWCGEFKAAYIVPVSVDFVDHLPVKSSNGPTS